MFTFKQFTVGDARCAMKVGTDGVLLGAWTDCETARTIIDAGCGSGLISLMMAQRNPHATVFGLDIEPDACQDAMDNVMASPWADRIEIRCGNVLTLERTGLVSPLLIVSNPPFFSEQLRSPEPGRSLARHGEGFGVETLIRLGGRLLSDQSDSLSFIAPSSRTDEIEFLLALERLDVRRRAKVFSRVGRPSLRTLYQVGRGLPDHRIDDMVIVIRDEENNISAQFKRLTLDFYLDK